MMASTTASRGRQALAPMSNQKDASIPAPVAPSETEVSECEDITFTKEEVIELLNDKFKGKKFDTKVCRCYVILCLQYHHLNMYLNYVVRHPFCIYS